MSMNDITNVHQVVIIGAGITGLHLGVNLKVYKPIILEASHRHGGRIQSMKNKWLYPWAKHGIELGAHMIHRGISAESSTVNLCKEAGLKLSKVYS